jgi:hypothetical protein
VLAPLGRGADVSEAAVIIAEGVRPGEGRIALEVVRYTVGDHPLEHGLRR